MHNCIFNSSYIDCVTHPTPVYRKQLAKWNEVAGSSAVDITTTRCEAYELTKLGQVYEVVPEHEYDVIPAFEEGQQMQGQQMQGQQEYENITAQSPVPTVVETAGRVEN